jgi:hypothetical protein
MYGTSTSITSSLNPSTFGQSVQFNATVSSSGGTPTGTVTFKDGNTIIGNNVLLVGNTATLITSSLPAGVHHISATYNGDSSFASSTGNVTQTVGKANSTTKVTSSLNPSNRGQSVKFTATVSSAAGIPTGKVMFMDGNTTLGTGTLNAAGIAIFSTSSLSKGAHSITVVYIGDNNFNGSTSGVISQTVN